MPDSPETKAAVYLHILSAFLFVSSTVTASVARFAALSGDRKDVYRIAALLSVVRPLVALVVISLLLTISFGLWAGYSINHDMSAPWLIVAYVLVSWMALVGSVAGRHDRHTREMAQRLASSLSLDTPLQSLVDGRGTSGTAAGAHGATAATPASGSSGSTTALHDGDSVEQLHARLRSPVPMALNISMLVSIVVVLAMMVFRPGVVEPED